MKKIVRVILSCLCILSLLLVFSPVINTYAETDETPNFYDIDSVPDNIKFICNDVIAKNNSVKSETIQIVNTNDSHSILFEDNEGNGVAKVFGVPIRYENENGEMEFIDTSMTKISTLSAVFSGYDYENAANGFSYKFSKKPDKGIKVDKDFTFSVYNPDKIKFPKGYADQTTEGDGRFVYPEAFGEYTTLEYININTGIKENIILEKNIGTNRFAFLFTSKKYTPVLSEDQATIKIVNKNDPSDIKCVLASLYVYDSFQPEFDEEPETTVSTERVFYEDIQASKKENGLSQTATIHRHFTEDNHYEIQQISKKEYIITSVVDNTFLNHSETVYPVTIDPTFYSTPTNAQDSYVWENTPTTNYGDLDYMRFGYREGGEVTSYFKFTQLPLLPNYVNITNATLRFEFRNGQGTAENGVCYFIHNGNWNENTLTWNNQPYGTWGYDSSHHNAEYYEFFVRPFVDMWYYGGYPNYGVQFGYKEAINDYNSVVSSEGSAIWTPNLTITYSYPASININTSYALNLELGTNHWYKFKPIATNSYSIYTTGSVDTYGSLEFFSDSRQLMTSNDDGGNNLNFKITRDLAEGIEYYICVRGYDFECTGSAIFRIQCTFDEKLTNLYTLSKAYSPNNNRQAITLTLQFLRYINPDYRNSSTLWTVTAGSIDENFISYVETQSPSLYQSLMVQELIYPCTNGTKVDIPHMAATLNAYLYDSNDFFGIAISENNIDTLAGWGGDLRSSVAEILHSANYATDYTTVYNAAMTAVGAASGHFSDVDYYADIDALNLMSLLSAGNLSTVQLDTVFKNYYLNSGYNMRFTAFVGSATQSELANTARTIINHIGLDILLPIQDQNGNTISVSNNQFAAIANAFAAKIFAAKNRE